jgi:CBS domain containing-hemolysin-like protein
LVTTPASTPVTTVVEVQTTPPAQTIIPDVSIKHEDVPLTSTETDVSLLNLILAALALLLALGLAVNNAVNKSAHSRATTVSAAISVVIGFATTTVWFVLDGLRVPTSWTDIYTPVIAALFAAFTIAFVAHVATRRHRVGNEVDYNMEA